MTPVPAAFSLSTATLAELANEVCIEYQLAETVPSAARAAPDLLRKKSLLITGGAGFLGVHMLEAFVRSDAFEKIHVLVRRPETLLPSLLRYGINPEILKDVVIVQGDLTSMLASAMPDVDVVIHSAARIHGLKSLRHLWSDNVTATARLFARYQGNAEIHFISTLSVFVSSNCTGEHHPVAVAPTEATQLFGGYAQSKYVCECLAQVAGINIIRLGLLTGSSNLGQFPEYDFFSVFLNTMKNLACAPSGVAEAWVDLTPVDCAANRIAQYVLSADRPPILHIANSSALSASALCEELGLKYVDADQFKALLAGLTGIERVLLTFAFFKEEAVEAMPSYFNIDLFQSTNHSYGIDTPFPVSNATLASLYVKVIGSSRAV